MNLEYVQDTDYTSDLVTKLNNAIAEINGRPGTFISPLLDLCATGQQTVLVPAVENHLFVPLGPVTVLILYRNEAATGTPVLKLGTTENGNELGTVSLSSAPTRKLITSTLAALSTLRTTAINLSVGTAANSSGMMKAMVLIEGFYTDITDLPEPDEDGDGTGL
ncbi:MAG: hypothetical protein V4543_11675 [Bacteroidota bacterium]